MAILTQGKRPWGFVLSEAAGHRSRDNLLIGASQNFGPGRVLAKLAAASGVTVTQAADAGNTGGSGALTLASPAYTSAVKRGRYRVVCIEPVTNAGTFNVEDPSGVNIGVAKVGVAFAKQIKFTIADATDFVAGDSFNVDVVIGDAGGDYYVAHDPTATDGSEIAGAVAGYGAVTGVGETVKIGGLRRHAEVNKNELVWASGATSDQIALGQRQLADVGILAR